MTQGSRLKTSLSLLLLTIGAFLVHGYHPAVEDANIYLTAVKKTLHPQLYPFNDGFFASHMRMTLFPQMVKAVISITHLPIDWAMLLLQFVFIYLLLYASLRFARMLFASSSAHWAGAAIIAGLLTLPIAGTALYLMDEYFNPRSVSMPLVLLLIVDGYEKRWWRVALWAVLAGCIHPLMIVFGVCYLALSWLLQESRRWMFVGARRSAAPALLLMPFGIGAPTTEAYRQVLQGNSYFFLQKWAWYEWLGAIGPLIILELYRRLAHRTGRRQLERVCFDMFWFGVVFTVGALIISLPARLASLTLLQPMRAFQLIYVAFLIISAGFAAEYLLKNKAWRWALVFLPLCAGMYFKQRDIFSGSPHLELPWVAPHNPWVEAFRWIRNSTPEQAYFALPPDYVERPGEDVHSFRAIAERSALADAIKDRSAMTMFPPMAQTWQRQARAQDGWDHFQLADFERLKADFGVNWVVVTGRPALGLACPYINRAVAVCRLP